MVSAIAISTEYIDGIVAMPTTRRQSSLSGVVIAGTDGIKHSVGDSKVETLERTSGKRMLQVVPGYGITRFTYHGVSQINPADSHLLLLKQ